MTELVVSIDGDSKGLVGSLKQADDAMSGMRDEARKLTDQLREVADDADKAAGEIINKIGGPGAIKAIAGVGIAFGAVKTGVEAFLDSSERMFQSYGDEGRQMWDKVEESLRGISGAFAEVTLGSGDLADKAATLQTMFEGIKAIAVAVLEPIGSLLNQFIQMGINIGGLNTRQAELATAFRNTTKAITEQANSYSIAAQMMADAEVIAMGLLGMEKQREAAAHRATQEKLIEARQTMQNTIVEREFANELQRSSTYYGDVPGLLQKAGVALDAFSDADTAAVEIMRSGNLKAKEKEALILQVKLAYDKITPAIDDYETAMQYATDSERESLDLVTKAAFADKARPAQINSVTRAVKDQTDAFTANSNALLSNLDFHEQLVGTFFAKIERATTTRELWGLADIDFINAHADAIAKMIEAEGFSGDVRLQFAKYQAKEAAKAVIEGAKQTGEEIKTISQQTAEAEKEATKDMVEANVKQYGRLAGAVISGEMSMADAARSALGNIVMAIGDSYAVKAGGAAIESPWLAAKYAAAATVAYTVGAYLGATDKGQGDKSNKSDTPATEKAAPVATNVTYALRVDAAFADGESIARRFAQMQAAAQSRGLLGAIGAA